MIETNWCVLTGAPCSGKTTVLNLLQKQGYHCVPEAARVYIEEEIAKGYSINEIRADELAFQNKILAIKKQIEAELPAQKVVILDRAMPDSITYIRLAGLDSREALSLSKLFKYKFVFFFDLLPWDQDAARNENSETVALLDKQLQADYRALGYEPMRVPMMPVQARVDLILNKLLKPS